MQRLPMAYKATYNSPNEIDYSDDSLYFHLVDLSYPKELHDRDKDFPYCPHHYNHRLCTTLFDKKKILLSEEMLAYYTHHGLVVDHVYAVYEFTASAFLKDYITSNIDKRKEAKANGNTVMSDLYKLLNNSAYGKMCENVFKYKRYSILQHVEHEQGVINPRLTEVSRFIPLILDNDDEPSSYLVENPATEIVLDKPIHIGFMILEYAKLKMYELVTALRQVFGTHVQLLYTDTDSLMYWIKPSWKGTEHDLVTLYKHYPELDFAVPSDIYPTLSSPKTIGQAGLWSDETDNQEIVEFVGLRAKTYAVRYSNGKEKLRNKGVAKNARLSSGDKITFEDYLYCWSEQEELVAKQVLIRSKQHQVGAIDQFRVALNFDDSKRIVLPDQVHTLPFGHYDYAS